MLLLGEVEVFYNCTIHITWIYLDLCTAALLTVEEDAFWEPDIPPVHFGNLPRLQDSVSVVGYILLRICSDKLNFLPRGRPDFEYIFARIGFSEHTSLTAAVVQVPHRWWHHERHLRGSKPHRSHQLYSWRHCPPRNANRCWSVVFLLVPTSRSTQCFFISCSKLERFWLQAGDCCMQSSAVGAWAASVTSLTFKEPESWQCNVWWLYLLGFLAAINSGNSGGPAFNSRGALQCPCQFNTTQLGSSFRVAKAACIHFKAPKLLIKFFIWLHLPDHSACRGIAYGIETIHLGHTFHLNCGNSPYSFSCFKKRLHMFCRRMRWHSLPITQSELLESSLLPSYPLQTVSSRKAYRQP